MDPEHKLKCKHSQTHTYTHTLKKNTNPADSDYVQPRDHQPACRLQCGHKRTAQSGQMCHLHSSTLRHLQGGPRRFSVGQRARWIALTGRQRAEGSCCASPDLDRHITAQSQRAPHSALQRDANAKKTNAWEGLPPEPAKRHPGNHGNSHLLTG